MFELLSNLQSVPVEPDALVTIQRGMNKVRVSVGEHNSEPSEVYIITGQADTKLETYIIFYMLEPRIHVVYGFDQNPYGSPQYDQVLEEATVFVEEMGSILEEVPLESMTPEQRTAWYDKELLYSEPEIEELEEIEDLDELEELEEVEVVPSEEAETVEEVVVEDVVAEVDENIVQVSDEEVIEVLSENDPEEVIQDSLDEQDLTSDADIEDEPEDHLDVDSASKEDVVVAEGDFDELLKQAFLKPDVVEKTRRKEKKQQEVPDEEEPLPVDQDEEKDIDAWLKEEIEAAESEAAAHQKEDISEGVDSEVSEGLENDSPHLEETVEIEDEPDNTESPQPGESEIGLKIVRFLSKF